MFLSTIEFSYEENFNFDDDEFASEQNPVGFVVAKFADREVKRWPVAHGYHDRLDTIAEVLQNVFKELFD